MTVDSVRAFFVALAPEIEVIESNKSSATVTLAAEAFGVTPAEIAKTLSLRVGDKILLVMTCGTARLDNKKARAVFGGKARMLNAEEALDATGHPVGGICPFGLKTQLPVYCDVSLKNFSEVVPAAGSINSAVRISPARMAQLSRAKWVDVCEIPA